MWLSTGPDFNELGAKDDSRVGSPAECNVGRCKLKMSDVVWAVSARHDGTLIYFATAKVKRAWLEPLSSSSADQVVVQLVQHLSGNQRTAISAKRFFDVGRCSRTMSTANSRCFQCDRMKQEHKGQWRFTPLLIRLCNNCSKQFTRSLRRPESRNTNVERGEEGGRLRHHQQ